MNLRQQVEYKECPRCIGKGRIVKKEKKPLRINCEYVGTVFTKTPKKQGRGDNKGSMFFSLVCEMNSLAGRTEQMNLTVFPDAVDRKLFKAIEESEYIGKKYLFYCNREGQYLRLLEWKELGNE